MGPVTTWEDLDERRWIQEGDEDPWGAVENFFHYIHREIGGRDR